MPLHKWLAINLLLRVGQKGPPLGSDTVKSFLLPIIMWYQYNFPASNLTILSHFSWKNSEMRFAYNVVVLFHSRFLALSHFRQQRRRGAIISRLCIIEVQVLWKVHEGPTPFTVSNKTACILLHVPCCLTPGSGEEGYCGRQG